MDLNLLRLFDVLDRHRNVASASRELGFSASAGSHGLARLRKLIDDDVFISTKNGLLPTPRATELAPVVRTALRDLAAALGKSSFIPSQSARVLVIAMADARIATIIPTIVEHLASIAPKLRLRIFQTNPAAAIRDLMAGYAQISLGKFDAAPAPLHCRPYIVDHEVIVFRKGHPLATASTQMLALNPYPYVAMEADTGLQRASWGNAVSKIAVLVPHLSDVLSIVATTDLITILPLRVLLSMTSKTDFRWVRIPDGKGGVTIDLVHHQRLDSDEAIQWLITELYTAIREYASADISELQTGDNRNCHRFSQTSSRAAGNNSIHNDFNNWSMT